MTRGSFVRKDVDVEEQELLSHVPEQEQAEEAAAATDTTAATQKRKNRGSQDVSF